MIKGILQSLQAFNANAFSYLVYAIATNLWFILLAAGALISIILYLREEISVTVRDEQQVL
ncbi:MAG: hypothetical protein LBI03_09525 [Clostridiales bacterium]|jgi:hypothetical protein|nr:hypothetical protein [Clostridiales bacterium]